MSDNWVEREERRIARLYSERKISWATREFMTRTIAQRCAPQVPCKTLGGNNIMWQRH